MILKKPKFWDYKRVSFWSVIFYPLSLIYLILIFLKKNISTLKTYKKPPIPVICIGNIYLGGTGKTPVVREIFKIIKSLDRKPAFIKKKYRHPIQPEGK